MSEARRQKPEIIEKGVVDREKGNSVYAGALYSSNKFSPELSYYVIPKVPGSLMIPGKLCY
ncbi:hypothetical protein [Methanosarcina sp. UBA5]|uniref:hypothetical protein n=1 Tax=Methanosarcina sp. UBA5 TaxID=1915593 RepID=UPI0025F9057A|nr:hypothetical protein [Methanosarcina sp. UBA5]